MPTPHRSPRKRRPAKGAARAGRAPAPPRAVPRPPARARPGAAASQDERIYATIHEAVLDHRLPPGTRLGEVALADLFGATRAVIRKVLARLAHMRLVDLRPNRGAVVASPTIDETRDLFAARSAIECAIVETLARSPGREQVRGLRALLRTEHDAYARGDTRGGLQRSVEFHRLLARMAGNGVLAEFLEQLVSRTPLVVLAHQGRPGDPSCANGEHSRVVDAIAAGDAERAVAEMREHLDGLLARLDLRGNDAGGADLADIFGVRRS